MADEGSVIAGTGSTGVALAMCGATVAMGTRFIATQEHEWHAAYMQRIVDSGEWENVVDGGIYAPIGGLKNRGLETTEEVRNTMSGNEFQNWEEEQIRIVSQARDLLGEAQVALKEPAWP